MTYKTLGRRYAAALFDVVQKSGDPARAERDLNAFQTLVSGNAELSRVFENPAVPAARKHALVAALLDASGDISGEVRRLLLMLAERDRLMVLPEVAAAYTERLMQTRRVVNADVTTATPLDPAQRAALAQALGKAAGSEVTINETVDPSIIGGVVARVGSVVYDGSVTSQIERIRRRLIEAGERG